MATTKRTAAALVVLAAVCGAGPAAAGSYAGLSGEQLYLRCCASCHGADGRGDGPVAPSLRQPVPDLTGLALRHRGEFPEGWLAEVIDGRVAIGAHGSRRMPVWGEVFWTDAGADAAAEEAARGMLRRLIEQLRSMQAAGR